jgi:hypothetical protein
MSVMLYYLCVLSVVTTLAQAGKVLVLSHQYGSHMMINLGAAQELAKRGHHVYAAFGTSITIPAEVETYGYTALTYQHPGTADPDLNIPRLAAKMIQLQFTDGGELDLKPQSRWAYKECELMMDDVAFIAQLKELEFDIAIVDAFPFAHCLEMVPVYLGVPFVSVATVIEEHIMRSPSPASYVPSPLGEFTAQMTFPQRMVNFLMKTLLVIPQITPITMMKNTTLLEKYITDPSIAGWTDLASKASLHFIGMGPVAESPEPTMPNVVYAEGISIVPAQPLDAEFEAVVGGATNGIVVVSFGSGVNNLPNRVIEEFLTAFGQRKEIFLWRADIQVSEYEVPDNVKLYKWLPQNDLLAHPKTKLFVTHCGNNGRYESIYHAVPMLGFPLFGDQPHNAIMIQDKGYGLAMKMKEFTANELLVNLGKILNSRTYHKTVKKASRILKSRPMTARQTTAYWVEHVMEFGDSHLRGPALSMPYYQYAMWDIYAVVMVALVLLAISVAHIVRFTYKLIFGSSPAKLKKE